MLCDQEGALSGDAFAAVCDQIKTDRWLAGSDPHHLGRGGKHTATGLAEKHLDFLKLSMLKMHADCLEQGVVATPSEICSECMMASNTILTYGGATPSMAVIGVNPRELSEFDGGAEPSQSNEDVLERSIRQRLIAKSCILKALVELRFTEANKTRPQQVNETEVVPGSAMDIYRAPDSKAGAGWHDPATLLELNKDLGSAIVV